MEYVELQITSNFSFLRGASHPEELVEQAVEFGYKAIAVTDRNSFAGIVRAHSVARKTGLRLIPACRLDLLDGPSLLAYPTDASAYARLSALITLGNIRAEKGECHLSVQDVFEHREGMKFVVIPPASLDPSFNFDETFTNALEHYVSQFAPHLYIAAWRGYTGDDAKFIHRVHQLAVLHRIPMIATNDVYYHHPLRRELQDIVTCVREKCTIYTAGYRLHPNAERHLKTPAEMHRLFRQYPDALLRTIELAEACRFDLGQLKYEYPEEITREGRSPQEELTILAWEGAHERYGRVLPQKTIAAIEHELGFIERMNYAAYFLTVYDIVRFARDQGILCQGRGSAANSTVCYVLGITSVDPAKFDLLFERFISDARNEPPDIDVDFEHERREEVIQYIYRKYGRDRAAIVATVTQQHQKGAIRDVARAMGLSVDTINRLSASIWEFTDEWFEQERIKEQGLDPGDQHLRKVLELTKQFIGFPRQLGQHTGGFVITRGRLSDLCPILNARMEDRTCIEWNKDDIDVLGFLKIDVLGLGMLTCIRKAFDLARDHYALELTLANIPQDDEQVYDMICNADTIGVFQIESRAQQTMLPRLKPRTFYDLVIEVAIVRPGPIQGDMVHPYLRRRNGEEPVVYPSKDLEEILGRTLGVPLFQEQAMKIAIVAAGFTPAEADELRRSMATFKTHGLVTRFEEKLINGMKERGYPEEYAHRVFKQLEGFGSYGFPESHAASFALLVYVSSWLKWYYPDVFACALLNSMPMGFYQPAQIVIDARKHDVVVREADINYSNWDNQLEEKEGKWRALRLGFRQIKGMREEDVQRLVEARGQRQSVHATGDEQTIAGFPSISSLRDAGIPEAALERLADADAFRSIGLDRRQALWEVSTRNDRPVELFAGQAVPEAVLEQQISLPLMSTSEHVVHDYATTSLSLKAHPVHFVREKLDQLRITSCAGLEHKKDGEYVKVSGLVLVRQRPGTAGGICFMTIEDETGVANLVIFESLFEKFRKEILQSRLIMAEGRVQREGQVIHVVVRTCHDLSRMLRQLTETGREDLPILTLSPADERGPVTPSYSGAPKNKRTQVRLRADEPPASGKPEEQVFPGGRNFR